MDKIQVKKIPNNKLNDEKKYFHAHPIDLTIVENLIELDFDYRFNYHYGETLSGGFSTLVGDKLPIPLGYHNLYFKDIDKRIDYACITCIMKNRESLHLYRDIKYEYSFTVTLLYEKSY